ncbi:hypothetical protein ACFL0W_00290 [Nanoarchaeota archaeon]
MAKRYFSDKNNKRSKKKQTVKKKPGKESNSARMKYDYMPLPTKYVDPLERRAIDVVPGSHDFFPLVDICLLMDYFDYPGLIVEDKPPSFLDELDLPFESKYFLWAAYLHSDGPNCLNMDTTRKILFYENQIKQDPYMLKNFPRFKSIAGFPFSSPTYMKKWGSARSYYRKNIYGWGKTYNKHLLFITQLLDSLPFFRQKMYFLPEPMKLQERFNSQTKKSQIAHKSLEALLKNPELGNSEWNDSLDDIRVDYDISLFYRMKEQQDEVKEILPGVGVKEKRNEFAQAFPYLAKVIETKRSSLDLLRNLALGYVIENLKYARDIYRGIEQEDIRDYLQTTYVKTIELERIINIVVDMDRKQFLLPHIIGNEIASFLEVYELYSGTIEKKIGLNEELGKFHKKYKRGRNSPNPQFVLSSMNKSDFSLRARFSEEFGSFEEPETVCGFLSTYYYGEDQPLSKYIDEGNINEWLALDGDRRLSYLVSKGKNRIPVVAEVLKDNVNNAIILVDFLKNHEVYVDIAQELREDLKRGNELRAMFPKLGEIYAKRDFAAMEEIIDIYESIERQGKYDKIYNKLSMSVRKEHPFNQDLITLLEEDISFVSDHLKDLIQIRRDLWRLEEDLIRNSAGYIDIGDDIDLVRGRRYVSVKGEMFYWPFLVQLSNIADREEKKDLLIRYFYEINAISDDFDKPADYPLAYDPDSIEVPEDSRPYLNRLVIIGGRKGIDYQERLGKYLNIGDLKVFGYSCQNRLSQLSSAAEGTVYLVVTGNVSHAAQFTVDKKVDRDSWVRSTTSGTRNMVEALYNLTAIKTQTSQPPPLPDTMGMGRLGDLPEIREIELNRSGYNADPTRRVIDLDVGKKDKK